VPPDASVIPDQRLFRTRLAERECDVECENRPLMWEVLLLAVVSAFWPALIAVALIALASPRPATLLVFFLFGGLLTTTALGLAIALSLESTSLASGSRPPTPPAVNIAVGALALFVAFVASRRDTERGSAPEVPRENHDRHPWTERLLARGTGRIAFLVGIVINLVPGFFAVAGYTDIARLDYGTVQTIVLVVVFNVIMFALIEAPLIGYVVAPRWTADAVWSFNTWLKRNGRRAIVWTATGVGLYLIVRGILQLLA
jgi:hypothetical protein